MASLPTKNKSFHRATIQKQQNSMYNDDEKDYIGINNISISEQNQSVTEPSMDNPNDERKENDNKNENTIIVFDYDDTLFPTHKLKEILSRKDTKNSTTNNNNYNDIFLSKMSEKEMDEFALLSLNTFNLLLVYISKYSMKNILIVTASKRGWIENSLKLVYKIGYFANIYHLLFPHDRTMAIEMIDPPKASLPLRQLENGQHEAFIWKYNVFKTIFEVKLMNNSINTFVFIGDSEFEFEAAGQLRDELTNANIKHIFIDRVKMMREPSLKQLMDEQTFISRLCGVYEYQSCVNITDFDIDYLWEKKRLTENKKA